MHSQNVLLCTLACFFQVLAARIVGTTENGQNTLGDFNKVLAIKFDEASVTSNYDAEIPELTELSDGGSFKPQNNQIDHLLNKCLRNLKECVDSKSFNFVLFEERVSEIIDDLNQLDDLIDTNEPVNDELLKKHRFAKEMYRTMVTFNGFRKNYQESTDLQDRLLAEINTLGVLRYELYDLNGEPDPQIEGYDAYLSELIARWTELKDERAMLKKSASIVRLILNIDFDRVRKSLVELANHSVKTELNKYTWTPL